MLGTVPSLGRSGLSKTFEHSEMNDRLWQMKEFWSSILFREDGILTPSRGQKAFLPVPHEVCEWLGELFTVPPEVWKRVSAERFPYSKVFVLRQDRRSDVPQIVAVKKIHILHEDGRDLSVQRVEAEQKALRLVGAFDGISGIHVPRLHGASETLRCIAIDYIEGERFMNLLLQYPLTNRALLSNLPAYASKLGDLGQWLCSVHATKLDNVDVKTMVRAMTENDVEEIRLRVEGLSIRRPADFHPELCKRINAFCASLAQEVIRRKCALHLKHGDFTLVNVLSNSGRGSVLDFTNFGWGSPEDDLSRIYLDFHNVDRCTFMFLPEKRGILMDSFFDGYGKSFPGCDNYVDSFYLLKHAVINIYMCAKMWGSRYFLNPLLSRLIYEFQKNFLLQLIGC